MLKIDLTHEFFIVPPVAYDFMQAPGCSISIRIST